MIHRIAITPGEPAGIGPDICVLISQQPPKDIELVFVADSEVLEERAEKLGIAISTKPFEQDKDPVAPAPGTLSIIHVKKNSMVVAGR